MAHKIVVLGAGIAGAQVVKNIHKFTHHNPQFSLQVIDKQNYTTFVPMLHEVATGSVNALHITHPIRKIITCCMESFLQAEIDGIDLDNKMIKTSQGEVNYDSLVIALGSTTNHFGVPGTEKHVMDLKTMQDAIKLRRHVIDTFEQASRMPRGSEREKKLHFVVIGGGYTGVETAGQLADVFFKEFAKAYPEISSDEPKITIVQGGERVLPILSKIGSHKVHQRLESLGVNVITGVRASKITEDKVELSNGGQLHANNVIWTSGVMARGAEFFPENMIEKGRIKVKGTLQLEKNPEVFVVGDIAGVMEGNGPHPQTAQAAFEQAQLAAENIFRLSNHEPLKGFYYKHKGDLVPVGNNWALAEIGKIRLTGFFAWWLRRTVYLQGLFSWNDRIRTVFDWTMNLFTDRDTTRL